MTVHDLLEIHGYEDVMIFDNPSFDTALVGVTTDNQAVYDYEKMVCWLMDEQHFTFQDAVEWIEYNTIRSLPYMGDSAPIIINSVCE